MKSYKILLASGLLLTGMFSACSKNDSLQQLADITFRYTYQQDVNANLPLVSNPSDTAIPSPVPIDNYSLPSYNFATNISQIASNYNTSPEKLISVTVDSILMGITAPPNLKLDFVKNMKLYISAKGQPEVLAAEKTSVPAGLRSLALDVSSGELKPYFQQDTVRLRIVASLTGIPPSATKINLKNIIKVVANPLK